MCSGYRVPTEMNRALPTLSLEADRDLEIQESVNRLCSDFPGKYWRELEDRPPEDRYPAAFIEALTKNGFLAALIPETYGGAGLDVHAAAGILEAAHAAGCNASACATQMHAAEIVTRHASEELKQQFLPAVARGELHVQALAVGEAEVGSDLTRIECRAEKHEECYVIDGKKSWVSRACESELLLLLARTAPRKSATPSDGLTLFLVDRRGMNADRFQTRVLDALVNDNAAEIDFDGVEVPEAARIGSEGDGLRLLQEAGALQMILTAAAAMGDARYFAERGVNYANERIVFDQPIGQNQGIQFPLAKAYADVQGANIVRQKAMALYDAGLDCDAAAFMAKHLAVEAAWAMAEACFTTHGGFAFAREYDIERKWRDVRVMRAAPESTNMLLAYIGERVLGMPPSY